MAKRRKKKAARKSATTQKQPPASATEQASPDRNKGYTLALVYLAASLGTGLLALVFVVMAVWIAYTEIIRTGEVRFKFLMMPVMNVLIASILFYYFQNLWVKARNLRIQLDTNTYVPNPVRVTRYDIMAILGFFLAVVLISLVVFGR